MLDENICIVVIRSLPPSYEHEFAHNSEAVWDCENTCILYDIFVDQVQKGNHAKTDLSKTGYKNVIQRFKERTGLEYSRRQFKNK